MTTARPTGYLAEAIEVGARLASKDREIEEAAQASPHLVPIDRIQHRASDTRKLTPSHVANLIESIEALGLLEPLVVDKNFRLLAGAHRLEAMLRLRSERPDAFGKHFPDDLAPVRMIQIDALVDQQTALGIEVAENAQRRNYSPAEIDRLAKRLNAAGYRDTDGRPKEGEKRLLPALAVIIGRSTRTVRRQLKSFRKAPSPGVGHGEETRPNGRVSEAATEGAYASHLSRQLAKAIAHYHAHGADAVSLVAALQRAADALGALAERLANCHPKLAPEG